LPDQAEMSGLVKNISTYSLGSILNKSIQFLLLPIYTRWLAPADYGQLELIYMILVLLNITNGLLIQNGYARIYFDYEEAKEKLRLYGSAIFFVFLASLVICLSGFTFTRAISDQFLNFQNDEYILKLVLISAFLKSMSLIQYKHLVIKQKPRPYISVQFTYVVITMSLTVYFVVFKNMGIEGILYSQITGGAIQLLVLSIMTFRAEMIHVSGKYISEMLGFSVFMLLPGLSAFVLNMTNRYFLAEFQDYEEVGIFSLGARIASVIPLLFTEPVKKALGPHIYSLAGQEVKCKAELKRFVDLFLIGLIGLGLTIALFSKEMIMIIASEEFYSSHFIVPILTLSYILYGTAGIVVLGLHITKKTWVISVVFVVSALVSLVMNYILIPRYGKIGASIAHNISVLVILTGYFIGLRKFYRINYSYGKYILLLALAAAIYMSTTVIAVPLIPMILIKILLLGCFIAGIYYLYLSEPDRLRAHGFMRNLLNINLIKRK